MLQDHYKEIQNLIEVVQDIIFYFNNITILIKNIQKNLHKKFIRKQHKKEEEEDIKEKTEKNVAKISFK